MAAVVQVAPNDPLHQLKIDGHLVCPSKWVQIPSVSEICVQTIAKLAVEEYNLEHKESFKYKNVEIGWFMELKDGNLLFRIHVHVTDCLARDFVLEAVVSEKKSCGEKVRKLVSAKLTRKN